ncbi:MAG: segregation/condensation protein A [Kaiparowitsia implicata GSE-PSE-MK54-09C]|jgi:segregation and condensation protein A|nr:segregation/condensation protein A [Kaiparowitsia implicata GSE-PSE-MK54-09C]
MAVSLAQNAIALLIDLAERGEIDPWDVKVIEVIDRFLSQLQPTQTTDEGRAPYEADLSESGQAFLYASVLVLLKADSLARQDAEAHSPVEDLDADFDDNPFSDALLPQTLERRIRRRAVARPIPNRRVTLQELIAQLEMMAAAVAEHKPRNRARRPRPQSRSQAAKAISQLAHQENLSELAAALDRFLYDHWDAISQGEDWVEFEAFLHEWVQSDACEAIRVESAHHGPQSDRVGTFWALLFLSSQSKVELAQQEFYKDLKIRSLAGLSDEALATLSASSLPD